MNKNEGNFVSMDDVDDLLDKQWEMQDQIYKKCKMKEKYMNQCRSL